MNPALLIEGPGEHVDPFALADEYQRVARVWDIAELPACWRGTFTRVGASKSPQTDTPPRREGRGRPLPLPACSPFPFPLRLSDVPGHVNARRDREDRLTRWLTSERVQRVTAAGAVALALLLCGLVAK